MSGDHNEGVHLFPFRTQKLSPLVPMVLFLSGDGRVGSCRAFFISSYLYLYLNLEYTQSLHLFTSAFLLLILILILNLQIVKNNFICVFYFFLIP